MINERKRGKQSPVPKDIESEIPQYVIDGFMDDDEFGNRSCHPIPPFERKRHDMFSQPPSTSLKKWNGILCAPSRPPESRPPEARPWCELAQFELLRCRHCASLRDPSEKDLCCNNGKCIIPDSVFPEPPESFILLCDRTPNFRMASREINNRLSFAHIGTDWDHERHDYKTGFVYRQPAANGGSFPCMYGLHGRIFHRIANDNGERGPSHYYMFPGRAEHMNTRDVSKNTWRLFHTYLLENSPIAKAYRCAKDVTHVKKTVAIMPDDEPKNGQEPFIVLGTSKNQYHPARLAYVAVPVEGEEIYLITHSSTSKALVDGSARSAIQIL